MPTPPALALALALAAPAARPAGGSDLLPFRPAERTLANGLKVIVVPTGFPNLVSLQIPVQTGSRNEVEPGKSGFAHFFEHMMFRGTKAFPPEKYRAVLSRAGARANAYTSDDYTNYHATFAKEDLEAVLRIEADRFQNLHYSEEAFQTESRAVLGEYNKNSAQPTTKLFEALRDSAFQRHPYKHTTMGFLRDIEDMPRQFAYSRVFFDRWYRPEQTAIVVAGDVDPAEVLPLVERTFGGWKRGGRKVPIPAEPPPRGPVYAHVPWQTPTLPWVAVAFHGPAFSETEKDFAALDVLFDLAFGDTSDLHKKLVEERQTVDRLGPQVPDRADPHLATVLARVKRVEDALAVRDDILRTAAALRTQPVEAARLAEAKANARYALSRTLETTEQVAALLARFVRYRRSYDTLNRYYRTVESLTPADLLAAARRYLTDERLAVTTLSSEPLPEAMRDLPRLASLQPKQGAGSEIPFAVLHSPLPQLTVKLLFAAGSAHDPKGKEGLAALSAAMAARAGSRERRFEEIVRALYPMAGRCDDQVDREMTVFTWSVHRDNWRGFLDLVLPMLLEPGHREEDLRRLRDQQRNQLLVDLRQNNEEELAKERLQSLLFAGTPYGHPALGTARGVVSLGLDDVRDFQRRAYTRAALTVGVAGDAPPEFLERLRTELTRLPEGPALPAPAGVAARRPQGLEVDIVEKETRATAISLGYPIEVTRAHPDFPALWLARAWLGEHRSQVSRLHQRIREARGLNYGDYAYVEAFPGGMFRFFPEPNVARRAQLFEIWIRPVAPENAHMALRIALHELASLIRDGLSEEDFRRTRDYLAKNVFLLTSRQGQQLGYALDSRWHGIGEFTTWMRQRLSRLTRQEVNRAIRRHLSATDLQVVFVTQDAAGLRQRLLADEASAVKYDAEKPAQLLEEDRLVGSMKLGPRPEAVRLTPLEAVFAE